MKVISSILRTVWALWCLIFFSISCVIIFPSYYILFLLNPNAVYSAQKLTFIWGKMLLIAFLIRVRIHGKKYIDKNKTYVFVSNHCSQLDIPACMMATPVIFRYLAKAELKKFPVVGYVISKLYLFVERKSGEGRAKSLEAMKKSLNDGISVFVYPEGTRNRGPQPLKEFYDGAFRLAIETQRPLAVLTILNSDRLFSPNEKFKISPGIIDCYWGKPIETSGMTFDNVADLKKTASDMMLSRLTK